MCTRTPCAKSSFVVPGPTLATRRDPGQEAIPSRSARSQKNRAALALAKRIQSKEERRPISRSSGAQSAGCVSRIVGKRTGTPPARRTKAASSPACSSLRVTRTRFPESVILSRTGLPVHLVEDLPAAPRQELLGQRDPDRLGVGDGPPPASPQD